ncbi:MAG: carboxylating nicotinate-nucleotide diphosphorylase [Gemmatimonadales bacterium]|nr:MAG: carboxylating nicotinate-nucleotide diphosphorylase [Gemmatimonadales bacterium]
MLPILYEALVDAALREDLGRGGDLTSEGTIPPGTRARGEIVARKGGVVAGLDVALHALSRLDPVLRVRRFHADGGRVQDGAVLAGLEGDARALLAAERTALNLLGHLSGIATATREVVTLLEGTRARVVCTRKTTPGLRSLEKYAVRMGGGANHRTGLDDGILIKDNHRRVAGGVRPAVEGARGRAGHMVRIELEVDTIGELEEGLALGVDAFLLDNMTLEELREAVRVTDGRAVLEASGGITPGRARAVAETGVDLLSLGWLTHSAPSLDVALDLTPLDGPPRTSSPDAAAPSSGGP